jgi:5-deoxy-glucuronate isomerase
VARVRSIAPMTDTAVTLVAAPGGTWSPLLDPNAGRLGAAHSHGAVSVSFPAAVGWLVIERGSGTLTVDGVSAAVTGRESVFDGPGWSALLGEGSTCSLDGDLDATLVWRAADRPVSTRIIDPADVSDEARGERTTARRVRTYVGNGPLIVGETLNPPGGWSSWPPHQHEHEECYLYRYSPDHGFGVHVAYDADADAPTIVRDGDIVRIADGWHPVVAAPGFSMYYLWALAGAGDTADNTADPRYA